MKRRPSDIIHLLVLLVLCAFDIFIVVALITLMVTHDSR